MTLNSTTLFIQAEDIHTVSGGWSYWHIGINHTNYTNHNENLTIDNLQPSTAYQVVIHSVLNSSNCGDVLMSPPTNFELCTGW